MVKIIAILGALAILATASKATPRKWVALLAVCVLLVAGCSAGGADGYYNDTPGATKSQPIAAPIPTDLPTLPPASPETASRAPSMASGTVMVGDDYAANMAIVLAVFCLSPLAFFLYVFGISGPLIRRYNFKRGTQN